MRASQLEILPKIEKENKEKQARILTFFLLFFTITPAFIFWLLANFESGRISLPKISSPFKLPMSLGKKPNDLLVKLDRWAVTKIVPLPGKWGLKINFLNNDFNWGLNSQDQFTAASLIKLPIVAAFYQQVETGKLELDQIYTLKESDKIKGTGRLQYQKPGEKISLGQLATLSLAQSDNTAAGILRSLVGDDVIESLILKWGMTRTDLENNFTSAEDVARFFQLLYKGDLLTDKFKNKMLADLTNTSFEDRIPAGVPEGIGVAHKIGTEVGVISDAGIVFVPNQPFVLVILSQKTNEAVAKKEFPRLVNEIYWLVVED